MQMGRFQARKRAAPILLGDHLEKRSKAQGKEQKGPNQDLLDHLLGLLNQGLVNESKTAMSAEHSSLPSVA